MVLSMVPGYVGFSRKVTSPSQNQTIEHTGGYWNVP